MAGGEIDNNLVFNYWDYRIGDKCAWGGGGFVGKWMGRRTGKGEGEGRGEREQGVWTFKHLDIFKYCVEYRYIYIFTTHCRQTLSRPTAPPP